MYHKLTATSTHTFKNFSSRFQVGQVHENSAWKPSKYSFIKVEWSVCRANDNNSITTCISFAIGAGIKTIPFTHHCLRDTGKLAPIERDTEENITLFQLTVLTLVNVPCAESSELPSRLDNRESTSSINMTQGANLRASVNTALAFFSDSPSHLFSTEEASTLKNDAPPMWK